MAGLKLQAVTKSWDGKTQVIKPLTLDVADGEFIVMVGPSGCGKSTLLRMVAGLERVSGGDIWIDNKRVTEMEPKDRGIAMVFQNYALYPHMSVEENMAWGLKIRGMGKEHIAERVKEAARILELGELLKRRPRELSGGQRQRAYIAMVIAQDTEYILLDEPTNNLDIYHATNLMRIVRRLCDELGKTVILVLHEINYAAFYSDYICAFVDGKIAKFGTVQEVITKENLSDIYKVDFEIMQIEGKPLSIYY